MNLPRLGTVAIITEHSILVSSQLNLFKNDSSPEEVLFLEVKSVVIAH